MTEVFNRADKIVIYMNPDGASQVIDLVSEYCAAYPEIMEANAPHFTKPVLAKDGSKVSGVGFAEEPSIQSREMRRKLRPKSYGDFISKILAQVLIENGLHNDMQGAISQLFADYSRNPKDPALNEPSAFDIM